MSVPASGPFPKGEGPEAGIAFVKNHFLGARDGEGKDKS